MKLLVRSGIYTHTADACRELGLKVGDNIQGREVYPGMYQGWNDARLTKARDWSRLPVIPCISQGWNDTRLTLLWVGAELAVWLEQRRFSHSPSQGWTEPKESSSWILCDRDWYLLEADEAFADVDGGTH